MQQSFLSNESQKEQQHQNSQIMPEPQKKMYGLQLPFMQQFKRQMEQIQSGIQNVLISLTNFKQGQKKRLPYNVLKNFQKNLKQLRKLKQLTIEQNRNYQQNLRNRQKQKHHKNLLFKQYLKHLGAKRQELKLHLSDVETRVRKLEDTGYAQFVQYDVFVPEINTIRLPFSAKKLLSFVISRDQLCEAITNQIIRRKKMQKQITNLNNNKYHKQEVETKQTELDQKRQIKQQNIEEIKLSLVSNPNSTLNEVLSYYKTYKYYSGQRIILYQKMDLKKKKNQHKISIDRLKTSIKLYEELLYKTKLKIGFMSSDKNFTKTDSLIYFKQMKAQIDQKLNMKIFYLSEPLRQWRSKSCCNFRQIPNSSS